METHRHMHDGWHAKAKSEEEELANKGGLKSLVLSVCVFR